MIQTRNLIWSEYEILSSLFENGLYAFRIFECMNMRMKFIEWRIFKKRKVMKKAICDFPRHLLCLTLDDDDEFCVKEFFRKLFMIKMKTFFFPSFWSPFVENILIKRKSKSYSKKKNLPPCREEEGESFWFKWFK